VAAQATLIIETASGSVNSASRTLYARATASTSPAPGVDVIAEASSDHRPPDSRLYGIALGPLDGESHVPRRVAERAAAG